MASSPITRVVVSNGLSESIVCVKGRVEVAHVQAAICREHAARPCDVLLFHEGVALTNDAMDLRDLPISRGELRLRMVVAIFIPQ